MRHLRAFLTVAVMGAAVFGLSWFCVWLGQGVSLSYQPPHVTGAP